MVVFTVLGLILLKPTVNLLYRIATNHQQEFFRFTITNIVCLTAICAVFVHQFKLINWQPVVQEGWRGFLSSPILIGTASVILAIVAGWLAARVAKFPRTNVLVFLIILAILGSWNSVAGLTFPLYGESYELWIDLGYFVQKPLIFAGTIIWAGINCRSPAKESRSVDPALVRRTYTIIGGRLRIGQQQD